MIKSKTTFVTILIALMLAIIDAGLFKLCMPAFVILTGALALYGYFRGAADFCGWLRREDTLFALELPEVRPQKLYDWEKDADEEKAPVEFSEADQQFIDSIVEEMREATAD